MSPVLRRRRNLRRGPVLIAMNVTLPPEHGGTCCHVTVYRGGHGRRPVAIIDDPATNPGASARLTFPLLTRHITRQLPRPLPDLLWVLRSESPAVASVLTGARVVLRDHLMLPTGEAWLALPLRGEQTMLLTGHATSDALDGGRVVPSR